MLATAAALPAAAQTGPQPPLPTVQISAGIHIIRAEVADSDQTRRDGLMFRREAHMLYGAINSQTLGFIPGVCLSRMDKD